MTGCAYKSKRNLKWRQSAAKTHMYKQKQSSEASERAHQPNQTQPDPARPNPSKIPKHAYGLLLLFFVSMLCLCVCVCVGFKLFKTLLKKRGSEWRCNNTRCNLVVRFGLCVLRKETWANESYCSLARSFTHIWWWWWWFTLLFFEKFASLRCLLVSVYRALYAQQTRLDSTPFFFTKICFIHWTNAN